MALESINPTKAAAWQKLTQHFEQMSQQEIKNLFASDPARAQKFHIQWNDFLVDYSKNIITADTLKTLLQLAEECGLKAAIEAMYSGEKINATEGRSVLHIALRNRSNRPILVDGVEVHNYELGALRHNIGVVLQDVFLFADTILNNITLRNPSISREQVIEAAQKIGVHEFIMSLPGGYDYNVKERGVMLSSGQRQLIAFLRAYVSEPSILILDEATSALDTEAERRIQAALDSLADVHHRPAGIVHHRLAGHPRQRQHAGQRLLLGGGQLGVVDHP